MITTSKIPRWEVETSKQVVPRFCFVVRSSYLLLHVVYVHGGLLEGEVGGTWTGLVGFSKLHLYSEICTILDLVALNTERVKMGTVVKEVLGSVAVYLGVWPRSSKGLDSKKSSY